MYVYRGFGAVIMVFDNNHIYKTWVSIQMDAGSQEDILRLEDSLFNKDYSWDEGCSKEICSKESNAIINQGP